MEPAKLIAHSYMDTSQMDTIFESISDGIILVDDAGRITYANSACYDIFHIPDHEIIGKSFQAVFLSQKKNRNFNQFFHSFATQELPSAHGTFSYLLADGEKLCIEVQLSYLESETAQNYLQNGRRRRIQGKNSGKLLIIKDRSIHIHLKQTERDCAFIFSGLIFCITSYLMTWSLIRFTLHIRLSNSIYTLIIEGITFLLFLEIIFMTSFSMKKLGLLPRKDRIQKNIKETALITIVYCAAALLLNVILRMTGHPVKPHFIGGSVEGCTNYLLTAFVQEFLARGVIQTCIKYLVKIKYQKFFSILLTSLLFSLMHMPFGFPFMMVAFVLSMVLGYVYERQKDLWGCFLMHWICGYLTMCLFFYAR